MKYLRVGRASIQTTNPVMIIYFDDSGTHSQSSVAVAACYVAPTDQWTHFERDWKLIADDEYIAVLHMADFDRHKNPRALRKANRYHQDKNKDGIRGI